MEMRKILAVLALAAAVTSCGESSKDNPSGNSQLAAPSDIVVTRTSRTSVNISWKDNSEGEKGFSIWIRDPENTTDIRQVGSAQADETSFDLTEGLVEDHSWYFGVKAEAADESLSSKISYTIFFVQSMEHYPVLTIESLTEEDCSFVVKYTMENTEKHSNIRYGLCWSADGVPTVDSFSQAGPPVKEKGETVFQVIPDSQIEHGKTYKVALWFTSDGGTWYSDPVEAKLKDAPEAITLSWEKVSVTGLPSTVEIYESRTPLSGRNFHAWYAIADPESVDFRVQIPSSAATVDDQAAALGSKCLVLINGGYFYNDRHTGIGVVGGTVQGSLASVRGSLRSGDPEYNVLYNVTRGVFGVDASGKPSVYWCGSDAAGAAHYFDRPLPSVRGETKWGPVTSSNPSKEIAWKPAYALSAGPALLYEGRIPFNFTETSKGTEYYLNNFEIMPYDIFGKDVLADRTAVGYTEEGKIILFICDGRIEQSRGANLLELARILKGLGCVGAVNFDGGGSTGMVAMGNHLNSLLTGSGDPLNPDSSYNRPVVSTIAFFAK